MKKQLLVNLIKSHYEGDGNTFFHSAMEVLKEFKEDGDKELVEYLEFIMKPHIKLMPKKESDNSIHEINLEESIDWGWVPQESTDYSICPKCGSHNIESNKDINDAFIRCRDCGHYLREGKK